MVRQFEQHLNNSFSSNYHTYELLEKFIYLTSPQRHKPVRKSTILKHIAEGTVGSMLRKHDSIAFYAEYNSSPYYRK